MAPRYATETFSVTIGGAHHTVVKGARRDSTHPAVLAAPALFTTSPLPPPGIHPQLQAYMMTYPAGPEL